MVAALRVAGAGAGAEDFAGCGVDDAYAVAVDEQDDAGSVVGVSEADVVKLAVDAHGDAAGVEGLSYWSSSSCLVEHRFLHHFAT